MTLLHKLYNQKEITFAKIRDISIGKYVYIDQNIYYITDKKRYQSGKHGIQKFHIKACDVYEWKEIEKVYGYNDELELVKYEILIGCSLFLTEDTGYTNLNFSASTYETISIKLNDSSFHKTIKTTLIKSIKLIKPTDLPPIIISYTTKLGTFSNWGQIKKTDMCRNRIIKEENPEPNCEICLKKIKHVDMVVTKPTLKSKYNGFCHDCIRDCLLYFKAGLNLNFLKKQRRSSF